jgi:hypothetical protein
MRDEHVPIRLANAWFEAFSKRRSIKAWSLNATCSWIFAAARRQSNA